MMMIEVVAVAAVGGTWLQLGRLERPLPPPRQRLLMTLMGSKPTASLRVGMATNSVEMVDSCFSADNKIGFNFNNENKLLFKPWIAAAVMVLVLDEMATV